MLNAVTFFFVLLLICAHGLRRPPRLLSLAAVLCSAGAAGIGISALRNAAASTFALFLPALVLVLSGIVSHRLYHRPLPNWQRPYLNTQGIFRRVRHPVLGGHILLIAGLLFFGAGSGAAVLCSVALACILLAARTRERRDRIDFGRPYSAYCRATSRFIPFLF